MTESVGREVQVLKWQVRALTMLVVAMVAAFSGMAFRGDGVGRFERVETKAFVLKDDAGKDRLKISLRHDGTVLQEFLTSDQRQQLVLKASSDGTVRIRSFLEPAEVSFFGKAEGTPGFSMTSWPATSERGALSGIGMYDEEGVQRATMQYTGEDDELAAQAAFGIYDEEGNYRVYLVDREDVKSGMSIKDDKDEEFFKAMVNKNDDFQFSVRRSTGEQLWDVFQVLSAVAAMAQ